MSATSSMVNDGVMVTPRYGDALIRRLSDLDRTAEERGEVEAGTWILSELGVKAAPLIGEVEALLESRSRKVRYWAIDVVHSSAGPKDGRIIGKALGLMDDIDVAVRRAALFFLARASESQLSAAIDKLGESRRCPVG